ncbi:hypothetical protein BSY18_4136 (plasmid) [Blastomonas sp. RAC04]|nr:hypothetical protein BSY18_4136 [Blastomonas sp. RAC04]
MSYPVLRATGRYGPETSLEIEFRPIRTEHLVPALTCQQQQLDSRPKRGTLFAEYVPQQSHLTHIEHPIARLRRRRTSSVSAGIELQSFQSRQSPPVKR